MLEKEFSSGLGYTVGLTGDYKISLFPRIAIEGSGLELYAPQDRRLLARAEHYSAAIKLLPFFRHEVQIKAVALRGGFLDLGVFTADDTGSANSNVPAVSVPQLGSLIIEDFSLVFRDENNIVALKHVEIENFAAGHEAKLEVEAIWLSAGNEMAEAELRGLLLVGQASESAKLSINDLRVKFGDTDVSGLSGKWEWNITPAQISGEMDWRQDESSAQLQLELNLDGKIAGSFAASYAQSLNLPAVNARAVFVLGSERLDFPEVHLQWKDEAITGSGCYWLSESPGLRLTLSAKALDLDAISVLFPPGRAGEYELPFNVSLKLQVESANYLGAKARNVEVKIGDDRGCSARADSAA